MTQPTSVPQAKGSKRWIQELVNNHPTILTDALRDHLGLTTSQGIAWKSPLVSNNHKEYRDDAFLTQLDLQLTARPLNTFWPYRGASWDALGMSDKNQPILVEAKAHIPEMNTPKSGATDPESISLIKQSLDATRKAMHASESAPDWSKTFYQYANRLAHLYLVRGLNHQPAYLVFLHCINDHQMKGPTTKEEWLGAIKLLRCHLGIEKTPYDPYIIDLFYDVQSNHFV